MLIVLVSNEYLQTACFTTILTCNSPQCFGSLHREILKLGDACKMKREAKIPASFTLIPFVAIKRTLLSSITCASCGTCQKAKAREKGSLYRRHKNVDQQTKGTTEPGKCEITNHETEIPHRNLYWMFFIKTFFH